MSSDPGVDAENASAAEPHSKSKRRADRASFVPTMAVLAVAVAAVTAAFMGTRPDAPESQPQASLPPTPKAVVRRAPPTGGAAPCEKCGVVESVLAAKPGDRFQMRIRMDDGSLRTVEQRGALAAGTRVVVDGGSVRLPG